MGSHRRQARATPSGYLNCSLGHGLGHRLVLLDEDLDSGKLFVFLRSVPLTSVSIRAFGTSSPAAPTARHCRRFRSTALGWNTTGHRWSAEPTFPPVGTGHPPGRSVEKKWAQGANSPANSFPVTFKRWKVSWFPDVQTVAGQRCGWGSRCFSLQRVFASSLARSGTSAPGGDPEAAPPPGRAGGPGAVPDSLGGRVRTAARAAVGTTDDHCQEDAFARTRASRSRRG